MRKVVLVGQPNVGKSTLLNRLTGASVRAANYPGTTVDLYEARSTIGGVEYVFVDTPGIYSLYPSSLEEEVTERVILDADYDAVIVVVDATALERGLLLVVALSELGVPMVVAVNFWEEAERRGIRIDYEGLQREIGVPIVRINPLKGKGVTELVESLSSARPGRLEVTYDDHIEEAIADALECIPSNAPLSRRGLAVRLVQGDPLVCRRYCCPRAEEARERLVRKGHDPHRDIETTRAGYAVLLAGRHARVEAPTARGGIDDAVLANPALGLALSLILILGILAVTVILGGRLIDLLDSALGPRVSAVVESLSGRGIPGLAASRIVEALYAQYTAALPYVFIFYILLVLLEDSGLLARMMVWLHDFTRLLGLHSKGVIPILLGLGCSVPATSASRILPGRRQRILAIAALAFVPCSSRATVIFGVAGRELGVWAPAAVYVTGFALASTVIRALSKATGASEEAILVEDIPPLRKPLLRSVAAKAWARLEEFILIVTPLVIVGAALYSLLEYTGAASASESLLAPLARLLGLPAGALIPLVYGFLQKDLVIAMLATVMGTTSFHTVMTPHQIMTFTLASTYQVPCVIALGAMIRELGAKRALALFLLLDLIGLAVTAAYAHSPLPP